MQALYSSISRPRGIRCTALIYSSGSFVAPVSRWYLVSAVAGGGGGSSDATVGGGGGQAGGFSQRLVYLDAGDTLTKTIGAGGAGSAGGVAGNGGNTTVTGPGISLSCIGGQGANVGTGGSALGTASGGEINVTGGSGGTNGGGGAVAIFGVRPTQAVSRGGAGVGDAGASNNGGGTGLGSARALAVSQKSLLINDRILQPHFPFWSTGSEGGGIGVGAPGAVLAPINGGMFAGGGACTAGGVGGRGGPFGGGGGGGANSGMGGAGGDGGVIVEYVI